MYYAVHKRMKSDYINAISRRYAPDEVARTETLTRRDIAADAKTKHYLKAKYNYGALGAH